MGCIPGSLELGWARVPSRPEHLLLARRDLDTLGLLECRKHENGCGGSGRVKRPRGSTRRRLVARSAVDKGRSVAELQQAWPKTFLVYVGYAVPLP